MRSSIARASVRNQPCLRFPQCSHSVPDTAASARRLSGASHTRIRPRRAPLRVHIFREGLHDKYRHLGSILFSFGIFSFSGSSTNGVGMETSTPEGDRVTTTREYTLYCIVAFAPAFDYTATPASFNSCSTQMPVALPPPSHLAEYLAA